MDLNLYSNCKEKVRSVYGKTQSDIDSDLEVLKNWIRKRPHLPVHLLEDDEFLERLLLRNKFSISKTKMKLENYCARRSRFGLLFDGYEDVLATGQKSCLYFIPTDIAESNQRVSVFKVLDEELYDLKTDILYQVFYTELLMRYDYSDGLIIVYDYSDTTMKLMSKFPLSLLVPAYTMIIQSYSQRIKQIHVVHKFAPTFKAFAKPFLPKKMYERIYCHDSLESLTKIIPRKLLPVQSGGDQENVNEGDWAKIFSQYRDVLDRAMNTRSNEHLRINDPSDPYSTETFRKLNID